MRVSTAIPIVLPLLPALAAAYKDYNEAITYITTENDRLSERMQPLIQLNSRIQDTLAPYHKMEFTKKYKYPVVLSQFINDNWKIFNALKDIDTVDNQLSNGAQYPISKSIDMAAQELNKIKETYCAPNSIGPNALTGDERAKCIVDLMDVQNSLALKYNWFTYPIMYKYTLHSWNYEFPFDTSDELKVLASKNLKNSDWIKWYEKMIIEMGKNEVKKEDWVDPIRLPKAISDLDQLNTILEAEWPAWVGRQFSYKPAEDNSALSSKELAAKNAKATKHVKSWHFWRYHSYLLEDFRELLESRMPAAHQQEEDARTALDALGPQAPVSTRIKVVVDTLAGAPNTLDIDPTFKFKKNKGTDGRGISRAREITLDRFTKGIKGIRHYPKLYMIDMVNIAELSYDPKLPPADKVYAITDIIRAALQMPRRTTQKNASFMKEPKKPEVQGDDDSSGEWHDVTIE